MNFPKFQRLVEERSGFRTMENATASGEYFSDSCGDMYNFFLKVGAGAVIEDISYFTTGCGFGTATCSLVVELAKGKTIDEAAAITAGQIESQLDGYPEKKKDYPERALEALQVAITDYRSKVSAGSVPDHSAMPRAAVPEPAAPAAPVASNGDAGKLLIKLR
ncbi:MAG TPA: iron-sulfur cluster assembly scaffold protein [Candidatus Baltobacteraceae bacterium]|jgi:NifU-like protein involved in Fe-S cluster formation|nr:iron-sulfur cluster assembly scaffold protein [Candidatus Baltobacteraceae bacterium]